MVRDGSLGFQPQVTVVMFVGDVAYAGGRGIFRSADQGATWSDLTAGLGGLGVPESDRGRFTVTGLGRSATQLYAAINANRPETGLWARDDRTGNWSQLTLPRPGFVSALVANDQRLVIAFDPNNGPSDPLTFVSDDAGRTWSALNGGRGLSAIVRAGSEIIAGGQGLWKLEKDRWVPIGSGSSSIVRSMARSDESSAFAAATDGVWRIQVP
ncbi:MAG: hypothetical protein HYX56_02875 [Chloroflexi bacterium]|nr:hypothetical protein [Chloroflexota bacterium]